MRNLKSKKKIKKRYKSPRLRRLKLNKRRVRSIKRFGLLVYLKPISDSIRIMTVVDFHAQTKTVLNQTVTSLQMTELV